METLFIAILSVCMPSTSCSKVDEQHYVKYISEPFVVTEEQMNNNGFMQVCNDHLDKLYVKLSAEEINRSKTRLCTNKELYYEIHGLNTDRRN